MAVRTSFTAGEVLAAADLTDTFGAKSNLASPTFTGTPAAPTATAGTNTTQLATTAFVLANRGKVLQLVRATDSTDRSTTSTSFVDVTGMSVTITPQKSTSAILIISTGQVNVTAASTVSVLGGYQITDSSNNGVSGGNFGLFGTFNYATSAPGNHSPLFMMAYSTPGTISAVTYKLRFRAESGGSSLTNRLRGDLNTSQLYAIEVSA